MKAVAILLVALTGCAHVDKVCHNVARADDSYARMMEYLEDNGVLRLCNALCQARDNACVHAKLAACELANEVLEGQRSLSRAYDICYTQQGE